MKLLLSTLALLACLPLSLAAQTFTVLHTFHRTDGSTPLAGLAQGLDGNLYGTTTDDATKDGHGTIYQISPDGSFTSLYQFDGQENGGPPEAGLTLAPDGSFYGVTNGSGAGSPTQFGTVYKFANGILTNLHVFQNSDGAYPVSDLLLSSDGKLYGTTGSGGAHSGGTVFSIRRDGSAFDLLHSFRVYNDGPHFPQGRLVEDSGALYGTTESGGTHSEGTLYKATKAGKVATLYSFCIDGRNCPDGAGPEAGLTIGSDGAYYGTTRGGGDINCLSSGSCGTIFKFTRPGLTTLHTFENTDGAYPDAPIYQATDGNFYGTASTGGNVDAPECFGAGCGTLFSITPSGAFTLLYTFCQSAGCPDGISPEGSLVQATDGNFYGTASLGGASGDNGTVFKLSLGLPPFVKLLPASGTAGQSIRILGNNLLGTTGITFNGTPAEFTVNANTYATAKVPAGATSGAVQVTTPNGVLSSNVSFQVSH